MAYINGNEILLGATSQIEVEKAMANTIAMPAFPTPDGTTGNAEYIPYNCWNYWQYSSEEAEQSMSVTITPTAKCLLVVCMYHRNGTATIDGDGWTQIAVSQPAIDGDINQYITIWAKSVEKGSHTITVHNTQSEKRNVKALALYGAESVEVIENVVMPTYSHIPPTKSGKRRLYLMSSIYANSDQSIMACEASNYDGMDLRASNAQRFSAFYDYEIGIDVIPTFSYFGGSSDYHENSCNFITLDVNEGE